MAQLSRYKLKWRGLWSNYIKTKRSLWQRALESQLGLSKSRLAFGQKFHGHKSGQNMIGVIYSNTQILVIMKNFIP